MTRKIGKALAWLLGGALCLVAVLYLSALAVNWRDEVPSAAAQRFTQPQATANRLAEHYWALSQAFEAPLEQYPEALERASTLAVEVADAAVAQPLYNPVGGVMLLNVSDFASYAARAADVEGVRRAALAAVTLRAAEVVPIDVQAALDASELRNSYDNSALEWDPSGPAIVFRGLEPGRRGEHRLYY